LSGNNAIDLGREINGYNMQNVN